MVGDMCLTLLSEDAKQTTNKLSLIPRTRQPHGGQNSEETARANQSDGDECINGRKAALHDGTSHIPSLFLSCPAPSLFHFVGSFWWRSERDSSVLDDFRLQTHTWSEGQGRLQQVPNSADAHGISNKLNMTVGTPIITPVPGSTHPLSVPPVFVTPC